MSTNWSIQTHASLPSTQDIALKALQDGCAEGTVIQAYEQPQGRGRFGNVWLGAVGNVYMSIVLRPDKADHIGDYAFVMAVAAAKAFADKMPPDQKLQLKWPNDVLVNGRKLAGILLEAHWANPRQCDGLVAGVGLNVDAPPEGRAGLNELLAQRMTVDAARDAYLSALSDVLAQYRRDGFTAIRNIWLQYAWGIGQPITVRLAGDSRQGIFSGLSDDGALLLQTADGVQHITSGEIIMQASPEQKRTAPCC